MPTLMERITELAGPDVAAWIRAEFGDASHFIARNEPVRPAQAQAQAALQALEEDFRREAVRLMPLAAAQS